MKHTKSFMMGCLITAFVVSLATNYLFYSGTFTHASQAVELTDDERLAAALGAL